MRIPAIPVILSIGLLAFAGLVAAPAQARPSTHVVCLNDDFRTWHERVRPHHCNFHSKTGDANGSLCFCHADTTVMRHLRWSRWRRGFAHGHGKIGLSTVGWRTASVTLRRVKWGWGPHGTLPYFTRARFKYRYRGDTSRYSIKLDVPRNGRI